MVAAAVALALAVAAAPEGSAASRRGPVEPGERTYRAVRVIDPIILDGKRTESTWKLAPQDDRFDERQPNLGEKPPVRTTMQVAYDDVALYVFIEMESEPGDVIVRTLRRDNDGIYADDTVSVKIDPQHTGINSYSFGVNAEGAQIDALGLEDGRQFLRQWDGVWEAETQRRHDGWSAEYRIPFSILGIKSATERSIGFDISRDHPSRNATYDWRLFVPPRSPLSASQFGTVTGLRNIEAQRALEYSPFFIARTNFEPEFTVDPSRRPNLATGADARIQIGAGSYVEASYLTDFAQVEADEVQVARDRFPLFFPERRPFFLNGLDVFQFGRDQEAQLFFSRRIGLTSDGTPVPILAGAKVYGRQGPVSYGVLQVQTLGTREDPRRGLVDSEPASFTVGRIRVQATKQLNVGVMALGQHQFGVDDRDHAGGGVDAQVIAMNGQLQYYGFLAGTYNERPAVAPAVDPGSGAITQAGRGPTIDVGTSAYSSLEYRGLFVRPGVLWLWSDADFDPALGFYRRTNATRQEGRLVFAPRPKVLGLREIEFGPRYSVETTPDYGAFLRQDAVSSLALNWGNGSGLSYEVAYFTDVVQRDFDLFLYTVEAGRYLGFRNRVGVNSPERRVLQADAAYEHIELFGGSAHQPNAGVTLRAGKHLTVGARYTHLVGHLRDASETFNFGFANGNVDIAFNRFVALDNLLRLDLSPGSERVGVQTRLRWRFLPGSDIFLVYRTDQPLGLDQIGRVRVPFHELTLKITYYMRALIHR
jgi:hypothetical protein